MISGREIKTIRKREGMTIEEMADYLDINAKTLSLYERNRLSIPKKFINEFLSTFEIPTKDDEVYFNIYNRIRCDEFERHRFGKKLKKFRMEELEDDRRGMAFFLDVPYNTYVKIEKGERIPSFDRMIHIIKMCDLMNF